MKVPANAKHKPIMKKREDGVEACKKVPVEHMIMNGWLAAQNVSLYH
ncbi:hypothetical protein [Glaciecola petra]|uniref:Uncharacterized protein n=1 Tax=Glaciecola petra TaxID=3075602 RepID=A0ABU2ZQM9_9ALTE|nr:hypothetical protein [Aestuariibacter sp. P117]MDT0594927.1 hypothetical protein [Aestuariibacter sp. P117]